MRKLLINFALAMTVCVSISAATCADGTIEADKQQKKKNISSTSIALSAGAYFPSSSSTRSVFSDSWTRINLTMIECEKPQEWRFNAEGGAYSFDGPTDLRVYSVSFGQVKGLGKNKSAQPYLALRAGSYYGKIKDNIAATSSSRWGLHANTALGVVFQKVVYVEARYDVFSRLAGVNLDGFSISAGVKLADIHF